jgi:hypothetical protein
MWATRLCDGCVRFFGFDQVSVLDRGLPARQAAHVASSSLRHARAVTT